MWDALASCQSAGFDLQSPTWSGSWIHVVEDYTSLPMYQSNAWDWLTHFCTVTGVKSCGPQGRVFSGWSPALVYLPFISPTSLCIQWGICWKWIQQGVLLSFIYVWMKLGLDSEIMTQSKEQSIVALPRSSPRRRVTIFLPVPQLFQRRNKTALIYTSANTSVAANTLCQGHWGAVGQDRTKTPHNPVPFHPPAWRENM